MKNFLLGPTLYFDETFHIERVLTMFRFEIIGMFAMIVSISVSSIVAEGAFMFLCLFISLRKSSSDSICFTFRITVVLFFFFFFCFLRCTCLMCLSRLWESLHVFEHWAQRNSCVVDSFSVLTNESSYASSTFSEFETVFHTQDKPLLPLALFPLRCVLWLCVYSDFV